MLDKKQCGFTQSKRKQVFHTCLTERIKKLRKVFVVITLQVSSCSSVDAVYVGVCETFSICLSGINSCSMPLSPNDKSPSSLMH